MFLSRVWRGPSLTCPILDPVVRLKVDKSSQSFVVQMLKDSQVNFLYFWSQVWIAKGNSMFYLNKIMWVGATWSRSSYVQKTFHLVSNGLSFWETAKFRSHMIRFGSHRINFDFWEPKYRFLKTKKVLWPSFLHAWWSCFK